MAKKVENPQNTAHPIDLKVVPTAHSSRRRTVDEAIRDAVPGTTVPLSRLMADILERQSPFDSRIRVGPSRASAPAASSRPARALLGQLSVGQILSGAAGRYRIQHLARRGDHSDTYYAEVVSRVRGGPLSGGSSSQVVIKIPRIPGNMTDAGAAYRLGILTALFRAEATSLSRLEQIPRVARVLDRGKYVHRLQAASKASVFMVQEYIDGVDLVPYLEATFGGKDGRFIGLPSAREFFRWARMLADTINGIHKHLVVHGLIWPNNVRVNTQGDPVLVDFGERFFYQVMDNTAALINRAGRYIAPERSHDVGGDMFGLGGLLHRLASGEDPPRPYEDIEVLKEEVESSIRKNNPNLLHENCGVADIIARCLRFSHKGRVENAAQLLRDIDTFDVSTLAYRVRPDAGTLLKHARRLDESGHSLLSWMAVMRVRELSNQLADMALGIYDLAADADTIRGTVAGLMSALGQGDEFYSTALPKFWRQENIGINGRFISKTKEAVLRGVSVKRIFLIDDTFSERELHQIITAQQRLALEVNYSPLFAVRWLLLDRNVIEQIEREGKHFGVFVRQGRATAFFPQYRADGTIEMLRFRCDPEIVRGLREDFERLYTHEESGALADLQLPASHAV